MLSAKANEDWDTIITRVQEAVDFWRHSTPDFNADELKVADLTPVCRNLFKTAIQRLNIQIETADTIVKFAYVIAIAGGSTAIKPEHLAESIQYQSWDREDYSKIILADSNEANAIRRVLDHYMQGEEESYTIIKNMLGLSEDDTLHHRAMKAAAEGHIYHALLILKDIVGYDRSRYLQIDIERKEYEQPVEEEKPAFISREEGAKVRRNRKIK